MTKPIFDPLKPYICDPKKNVKCTKENCGYIHKDGMCFNTINALYSKDGQFDEQFMNWKENQNGKQ